MISKEETEEGETTIPGEGKKLRKGEGLWEWMLAQPYVAGSKKTTKLIKENWRCLQKNCKGKVGIPNKNRPKE